MSIIAEIELRHMAGTSAFVRFVRLANQRGLPVNATQQPASDPHSDIAVIDYNASGATYGRTSEVQSAHQRRCHAAGDLRRSRSHESVGQAPWPVQPRRPPAARGLLRTE